MNGDDDYISGGSWFGEGGSLMEGFRKGPTTVDLFLAFLQGESQVHVGATLLE